MIFSFCVSYAQLGNTYVQTKQEFAKDIRVIDTYTGTFKDGHHLSANMSSGTAITVTYFFMNNSDYSFKKRLTCMNEHLNGSIKAFNEHYVKQTESKDKSVTIIKWKDYKTNQIISLYTGDSVFYIEYVFDK